MNDLLTLDQIRSQSPDTEDRLLTIEEIQSQADPKAAVDITAARKLEEFKKRMGDPEDRNFWGDVKQSFLRGEMSAFIDQASYFASIGSLDFEKDVLPLIEYKEMIDKADPIKDRGTIKNALVAVAGMLPPMVEGSLQGATVGSAAGIGAAVTGVGALPAFAVGQIGGSFEYWRRQGSGSFYAQMRKEKVDQNIALPVSAIGGAMYGAVEFSQVDKFIPGASKLAKKAISDSLTKVITRAVALYGIRYVQEVGEEGFQGIVESVSLDVAKNIAGDNKAAQDIIFDAAVKGWNDAKESALPMLFLMGPTTAFEAHDIYKTEGIKKAYREAVAEKIVREARLYWAGKEQESAQMAVVQGEAAKFPTAEAYKQSLPTVEDLGQPNNKIDQPFTGKFEEGKIYRDAYGENPYLYRSEYVDPRTLLRTLNLEGMTYSQVVQMPTTQKYIEWYKQGNEPPPITVVKKLEGEEMVSANRRRVVAAIEAGVNKIPAVVEIGRLFDIYGQEEKAEPVAEEPTKADEINKYFSKNKVERMMRKLYPLAKEVDETDPAKDEKFSDFIKRSPEDLEFLASNWSEIYNEFLKDIDFDQVGFSLEDVIDLWQKDQLKEVYEKPFSVERGEIKGEAGPAGALGEPKNIAELSPEQAKEIWAQANVRQTEGNKKNVEAARRWLFHAFNADPDLGKKLGLAVSQVTNFLRNKAGIRKQGMELEDRLNAGVAGPFHWVGISNLAWINRTEVTPDILAQYVKDISVSKEGATAFNSNKEWFCRMISTSLLGFDTRLLYQDLSFEIGKCDKETSNGQYSSNKNLITIKSLAQNTVSHEIAHYLDYKFARELGLNYGGLTSATPNWELIKTRYGISDAHIAWAKKFQAFVQDLKKGAEAGRDQKRATYLQDPGEVFARFGAKFIGWVENQAGIATITNDGFYSDKFTETQFRNFVMLLQEKAYLDAKENIRDLTKSEAGAIEAEEEGQRWEEPAIQHVTVENVKPTPRGIARIIEKINSLAEAQAQVEIAKEALQEINRLRQELKNSIRRYEGGKLKEELAEIPKYYIATRETAMAPDEAMQMLRDRYGLEINNESDLAAYLKNLDLARKGLIDQIRRGPGLISMKEITLARKQLKAAEMGFREGSQDARRKVQKIQEDLISRLKNEELDSEDKGKFLSLLKNIQTEEQLEKALPKIEERIAKIHDQARKKELLGQFKDLSRKNVIRGLRPEYKKPVKAIIDQFSVSKLSDDKAQDLKSLADYLQRNPDNQVPQDRIDELRRLDQKPLRDLSSDEIETIVSSIAHLIKLNDLKNKLIVKGKIRDHLEIVQEAIANVKERHDQLDGSISGMDSFQKDVEASKLGKFLGADSYNPEIKAEILDGEERGIIKEVLYSGIDRGVDRQLEFQYEAEDFFKEKFKGIDIRKWSSAFQTKKKNIDQVTIKISGDRELKLTKAERVAFYLHTLNDKNLKHLEEGGFAFPNTPDKIIKLTPGDIAEIAGSLTNEEIKVANAISEYFNTIQKEAANEVSVRLNGVEIASEENYFPIRTNWLDRYHDDLLKGEMGSYAQTTLEGMGIWKTRQNAGNAIILDDAFVATMKSIKQVAAYVGLAEPLRSAKALLNDNEFQKAVIAIGKKHYIDSLKEYLRRVEGETVRMDNIDQLTQEMINKLDVAILGLNPFVVAKQPVSYFVALVELDGKYLKGNFKFNPSAEEMAEINQYAPQIRDRYTGNITIEVGEVMNVGLAKQFFTGEHTGSQVFMKGIMVADRSAVLSIWRAVKQEISEKYPDLKGDEYFEKVYERAWEVVRRTQSTAHVKDRSTIGAKRDFLIRLLTKYTSQQNKNWMMMRRAVERYNRSYKTPKDKAEIAVAMFVINIVNSLFIFAVDKIRDIIMRKEQKQNLLLEALSDTIGGAIGNIYFLGPAYQSLISKIEKGTFFGYDISNPLISTVDLAIDAISNAARAISQAIAGEVYISGRKKGEEKWKASLQKSVMNTIDLIGRIKGIPVETIRRIITSQFKNEDLPQQKRIH
jgi:hypothetical protein